MKDKIALLAALASMSGVAGAQSTVILYGIVDAHGGDYKTNQISGTGATATIQSASPKKVESGGLSGSRWGIRFSEDLGDGLSAIGNLESGFALDSGTITQGGRIFGRRAIVGLSSTRFGALTVGRNTTSYNDVAFDHAMMEASPFDPATNNVSTSASTVVALGTLASKAAVLNHSSSGAASQQAWLGFNSRFDNSFKYSTPNLSGFTGSLTYGLGEGTPQSTSASLKYTTGALTLSSGYSSEGGAVNPARGTKAALQNTLVSVAYNFGVAKVGLGFNRGQYRGVTATGGDLDAQNEFNVSVAVPLNQWILSAGYALSRGDDLGRSSGFGLQAFYLFSKRTLLYMGGVSTKNYDKIAAAAIAQAPASSIGRTVLYGIGLRHMF